jgi:tetratricopeptide (TPR) repeat protein
VIYSVNPVLGLRKGRFMYIRHGVEELYDLEADPSQLEDLSAEGSRGALLEELRRRCSAAFPADQLQAALTPTLRNTSAELANLASLGYLGGPIAELGQLQKADMRAVIKDNDDFEKAREEAYQNANPRALLQIEPALLKRYPRATGLYKTFGLIYLKKGDTEKAYELYDKATRLNPRDVECLGNLGGLCLAMGQTERAKVLLEAGLALDESDPVIRKDLGILYSDYLNDPAKSLPHYRRYLELRPDDPDAEKLRAYVARMEQKYGKAG